METMSHVEQYLNEIGKIDLLTPDRERELGTIIRKNKGGKQRQAAREELISANLRLVVTIAYEYAKYTTMPIMDLIGAGNLGLTRSADRYNPKRKTKFSTYSVHWIKMEIRKAITKHTNGIHIPNHIRLNASRYNKIVAESHGDVTDVDCMEKLDISPEGLKKVQATKLSVVSLDQPVGEDSASTIGDFIEDDQTPSPAEAVEGRDLLETVNIALNELDAMSRDIVVSQCLSEDKVKLRKLGKKYKLTGERIRQIKEQALKDLKRNIRRKTSLGTECHEGRTASLSIKY
jgi:RNA polymerase sigma factor (sigma-70 family)